MATIIIPIHLEIALPSGKQKLSLTSDMRKERRYLFRQRAPVIQRNYGRRKFILSERNGTSTLRLMMVTTIITGYMF